MSWFRLDDQFHSQQKVIAAGNAAIGLYCRLGTYCADKLTDGFVAEAVARSMGSPKEIKALIFCPIPDTRSLLTKVDGGYRLRDYLEFNPSREQVLAERAKAQERMANFRRRSPDVRPNEQANNGRSSATPVPVPPVVTSISTPPLPTGGGTVDISDVRLTDILDAYAHTALSLATNVTSRTGYARRARATALEHPDLQRWLSEYPAAPASVIAACLHGDTHSLAHYRDVKPDDTPTATIHELRRAE